MPTRFSTAEVLSSQLYSMNLDPRVQVSTLARYLSRVEPNLDASTLELAKKIAWDQNLQSIDIQSGDRLLIVRDEPELSVLPPLLRSGDQVVRFSNAHFSVTSGGKRALLVGKSGEGQQQIPDVDLRRFISSKSVDYISRNCLTLNWQPENGWLMARAGNTRVLLDEFELGQSPVTLTGRHRVRFYRASDSSFSSPALGEIQLTVETVGSSAPSAEIEQGGLAVNVCLGLEGVNHLLRASEKLSILQIINGLARYTRTSIPSAAAVYQTRILSPTTPLESLPLSGDSFLYAPLNQEVAQHHLVLRHVHEEGQEYRIMAGMTDEIKVFGCRVAPDHPERSLDFDLYDSVRLQGLDPRDFVDESPVFGQIVFNVSEKLWQIKLDPQTRAVFLINNVRIKNGVFIPLISGDIVSFGIDSDTIHLEVKLLN